MEKTIDVGKCSEYWFAAELLDRNIVPLWPSTEMYPYDVVADTGEARLRVQVKGTRKIGPSISMDVRRSISGRRNRKYSKKDTDFIAIHVVSWGAWYIIPVEDIKENITLHPGKPSCKWIKYLAAWHLLDPRLK
jgi:hypothetical protein